MSNAATGRNSPVTNEDADFKSDVRRMWAMGDYDRFAKELIWEIGPVVVQAAAIQAGTRLLDVATGTGNVAIRAAQAGARVVACDLTPEHFAAARHNAHTQGVTIDWVEADAEALPFEDHQFDIVTSSVGAIFAPKHQKVADELWRVCKPGGTIVMANFTPEGLAASFFQVFGPYMPPPRAGDLPPVLWGSEDHVRDLFGSRLSALELTRRMYIERAPTPEAYCTLFKETFGPVVALFQRLADTPEEAAALDRAFLDFAKRSNSGPADGPAEYRYEYLLVVARK